MWFSWNHPIFRRIKQNTIINIQYFFWLWLEVLGRNVQLIRNIYIYIYMYRFLVGNTVVSWIISGPCFFSFWDFHFDLCLKKHGWATALAKVYYPPPQPRQSPTTTMNNSQHARTKYQQGIANNSKQRTDLKAPNTSNTVVVYSAPGIDLCVKVIELLRSVLINTGKVTILVGLSWRGSPVVVPWNRQDIPDCFGATMAVE